MQAELQVRLFLGSNRKTRTLLEFEGVKQEVCLCSPLKRMTVGMFLAALAFVTAALVQIQIDVRSTHTHTYHLTLHLKHMGSHGATPPPENPAGLPVTQRSPDQVHQHGEQRAGRRSWCQPVHAAAVHGTPGTDDPASTHTDCRPEHQLMSSLLLQAGDQYLTFNGSFALTLGPNATYTVSVADGTRNTFVIIQDGLTPTYLPVCTFLPSCSRM